MRKSGVMVLSPLLVAVIVLLGTAACSHAAAPSNVLYSAPGAEGKLKQGEELVYGDYLLAITRHCKLVIIDRSTEKVIWSSNNTDSSIHTDCFLTLQSDGKLVLYAKGSRYTLRPIYIQVWTSDVASNTKGNYALVLKFDGTVHVYGPVIWSKPSSIIKTSTVHSDLLSSAPSSTVDSTFWTGDIAPIGTIIAKGDYKLELHLNCNLTLSNEKTNETLWYTNSYDKYGLYDCFVSLGNDGQLAVKYLGGVPLWTSGATGPGNKDYVLALRPDGNLAIYGPSLWHAGKRDKSGRAVAAGVHEEKIAMVTEVEQ